MASTPPARKPYFYDQSDPDGPGHEPRQAATWLVDDFASLVKHFPDWLHEESGAEVALTVIAHDSQTAATIGWTARGMSGSIEVMPDPTGWLRIVGRVSGAEVFRGFLERPWEQYEIWPPGAAGRGEGPARMGKKQLWISLEAAAWPSLRPLAGPGGWVNFAVDEEKLRARD